MHRPSHSRAEIAQFCFGEHALVYVRRKDLAVGAAPYHLKDGTAGEVKKWGRGLFECLVPGCDDPRLQIVERSRRRDGFRHFAGAGGHAPESELHEQGKAVIARWVRERHPQVGVMVEQSTRDKQRRADVMLSFPEGCQLAIEVQYSDLSVARWRERQASYQAAGVGVVWLLGSSKRYIWQAAGEIADTGQFKLVELARAMIADGVRPLWINPISEQLGTAWYEGRLVGCSLDSCRLPAPMLGPLALPPGTDQSVAVLAPDPLVTCALSSEGIRTPTDLILAENAADAAIMIARTTEQHRRLRAEHERARLELQQRRQSEREKLHRERADREAQQREEQERWLSYPNRAQLIQRFGQIPSALGKPHPCAGWISGTVEQWHSLLYTDLILDHEPGQEFTLNQAVSALLGHKLGPRDGRLHAARVAIAEFLQQLEALGVLTTVREASTDQVTGGVVVNPTLDTVGTTAATQIRVEPPPLPTCRACGQPIDPTLSGGYHILC